MDSRRKPLLMQVADADGGPLTTVRADDIKVPTKPRHARLTDGQAARADRLFRQIGRWFSPTPALWRDGFLYDVHPEAELRVWEYIAEVVDALWVAEPKVLAKLNRERLARLVVAISTRVVDVPSQMPDMTDAMVRSATLVFMGGHSAEGQLVAGSEQPRPPYSWSGRITRDPDMMFGKPCIRGLRYPVEFVLELLDSGMTREEILSDYEDLEAADLDAAIGYASDTGSSRRAQMAVA